VRALAAAGARLALVELAAAQLDQVVGAALGGGALVVGAGSPCPERSRRVIGAGRTAADVLPRGGRGRDRAFALLRKGLGGVCRQPAGSAARQSRRPRCEQRERRPDVYGC